MDRATAVRTSDINARSRKFALHSSFHVALDVPCEALHIGLFRYVVFSCHKYSKRDEFYKNERSFLESYQSKGNKNTIYATNP